MAVYSDPNFTIILPGGCNAKCSFCTEPYQGKAPAEYEYLLNKALRALPGDFRQVSITGGEPTLSPVFEKTLACINASRRFEKVVLTTNGTNLASKIDSISEVVNHVNVSRHAIGWEENVKIFNTRKIPSDADLFNTIAELNKRGIDVNLNRVYTKDAMLTFDEACHFVNYAKNLGANTVTFRYDQNERSLEHNSFEDNFNDWKRIYKTSCPACRSETIFLNGMRVTLKASMAEPTEVIDGLYELILQPNGFLTLDWAGKIPFYTSADFRSSGKNVDYPEIKYGGCGPSIHAYPSVNFNLGGGYGGGGDSRLGSCGGSGC